MSTLHLNLKKRWFDMIASGEKTEEYREIKMHWASRFCDGFPSTFGIDTNCQSFKDFKWVQFTNGYRPDSRIMRRQCLGITIGEGRPEWGAEPGKKYFVIKLG